MITEYAGFIIVEQIADLLQNYQVFRNLMSHNVQMKMSQSRDTIYKLTLIQCTTRY